MFDTKGAVTYRAPPIENFDPKTGFERLAEITRDAEALILTLKPADDRKDGTAPDAVFASVTGTRKHLLLANRKADVITLGKVRAQTNTPKPANPRYPVWGSVKDRITPNSKISIVKTKASVALYYRDLFAHRLGASNAEGFFLMLLDGKVFATVGMNLAFAITGRPYDAEDGRLMAWQQFAMGTRHRDYKHLAKLLNMCITCEEFLVALKSSSRFPMGDPVGVRTVCISKVPEAKRNRGIMKLVAKEVRDDGQFHLTYQTAPWRPGGYADQLKVWLKKWGTVTEAEPETEAASP